MKYFSKKVIRHGIKFDSESEADRYDELILLQKHGTISNLEIQKGFEIIPKLMREEIKQLKTKQKVVYFVDERAAWYHCDFYYLDVARDIWIIEEFKSKITAKLADYVLRKKLIKKLIKEWNDEGNARYEFKEVIWDGKPKKSRKKRLKESLRKPLIKSTARSELT